MHKYRPVYIVLQEQDGKQIWVTAALFTQNYLDYIAHRRKSVLEKANFLQMNRFGL